MPKKISFMLSDTQYEDMQKEIEEGKFFTSAEAARAYYLFGWEKKHQAYKEVLKARIEKKESEEDLTEEEKIQKELERADLREKVKLEKKINEGRAVCKALGGRECFIENSTVPHCEYYTYMENKDSTALIGSYNKCPMEDLYEREIQNQFQGFFNERNPEIFARAKKLLEEGKADLIF